MGTVNKKFATALRLQFFFATASAAGGRLCKKKFLSSSLIIMTNFLLLFSSYVSACRSPNIFFGGGFGVCTQRGLPLETRLSSTPPFGRCK